MDSYEHLGWREGPHTNTIRPSSAVVYKGGPARTTTRGLRLREGESLRVLTPRTAPEPGWSRAGATALASVPRL